MKVKDRTPAKPLPEGFTHWEGPPLEAWQAWTPQEAARRLAGLAAPWCVVGGWSIDLFLGRQTREHEDLEIAIVREDFPAVRQRLAPLAFYVAGDGVMRRLRRDRWPPRRRFQNWIAEGGAWRMDVMLEPGDAATWVFRRDVRITAPRASMLGVSADGVPYLLPHGSLLYKAKPETRPKDEADLEAALPHMDGRSKAWLAAALSQVNPAHPWLARL